MTLTLLTVKERRMTKDGTLVFCRKCATWKVREGFYTRKGGKHRTPCRMCFGSNTEWVGSKAIKRDRTIEEVAEKAILCSSRGEFFKRFHSEYTFAWRRRWLDQVCSHMTPSAQSKLKPRSNVTLDNVVNHAKLCASKKEFVSRFPHEYARARRDGVLNEVCAHMKVSGNKYLRVVYSICLGKEVYVGLSFDPWRRFRQHVERGTALVKKLIANGGELRILTPLIPLEAAIVKETEEIQAARNAGFQVLNQTQGGETGGCWQIWTVESILDEAKKHQTRKAFAVYGRGAYSAARRHGILDEVCKHMPAHHMLAQRRYLQSRIVKSQGCTEDSDKYASDLIVKNRPPKGDRTLLTHAPAIDKTRGT